MYVGVYTGMSRNLLELFVTCSVGCFGKYSISRMLEEFSFDRMDFRLRCNHFFFITIFDALDVFLYVTLVCI